MDPLATALAFDRAIARRAAQRTLELPHGIVLLHDELVRLHQLNAVMLDAPLAPELDDEAIALLADRHLRDRPHRRVVFDDAAAAERLAAELILRNFTRERTVIMAWRREPDRPPRSGLAREVPAAELRPLELALDEHEGRIRGYPDGTPQVMGAGMDLLRATTDARCFAAGEDGRLAAGCTLFLAEGIAMIDSVGTLPAYRNRGLARAVIAAAVDAARAAGCEQIAIAAADDDWPKRLYARIGFEPLGRQIAFTRIV